MREQIEAVQRMQDYIESHLGERITPADLSRAALYSPWYAYRLFVRFLNMTPADYIRRLRLSRSALKLRDEKRRITDAAYEAGFSSVDGYQRAFLREFGTNPAEYARSPVPVPLFIPYGIQYSAIRKETRMEQTRYVFMQVVERPARKAIIRRGVKAEDYFAYCEEVGCDVWGLLVSIPSICGEPVGMWLPERYIKAGTSAYVQGVEVAEGYDGVVPDGFDTIDLPACKYLMFQGEPFQEEDYCQAIDEIWQAIDRYDPSVIGYAFDAENPRIQLEPIGTRGYIELVAVRQTGKAR